MLHAVKAFGDIAVGCLKKLAVRLYTTVKVFVQPSHKCSATNHPSRMSSLGAFILLLLVTLVPFSTTQNTYYVKPTQDTPCHEDPCHTLSEYVSEAEQYITSNTTMVFLPGEHALQENITVRNVGRLTFTGDSSSSPANASRIVCTDATLTFTNILILEITDLDFHSCTMEFDTSSAVVRNSSFRNGTSKYGGAIYTNNSTMTFGGETRFEENRATVFGGGIFAKESNLTFHGNTTFINNEAIEQGGGIHINQCSLRFSRNASFIDNSAEYGGGIYAWNSTVSFGDGSRFINNSAGWWGGGVCVEGHSTVSFGNGNGFIYNSAENSVGGGVYIEDSTATFGDESSFISNTAEYGGGVFVQSSTVSFGDDSSFTNNSAQYGGGVSVWYSTVSFVDHSGFIDNSAGSGGGVYVEDSTVSFGDDTIFIDNSAVYGGGVCVQGYSTVSFGDDSGFSDNSAQYGGGVSVWSSTVSFGDHSRFSDHSVEYGGGGFAWDSTVSFGDDSAFIDNSAEDGGGVFVHNSTVSFGDCSRFTDNSAQYGGGISVWYFSTVSFVDDSGFIDNSAVWGGGVYVQNSTVNFGDNSEFIDNSVDERGGGVSVWYSNVSFGSNSEFINNSAVRGGGVIVRYSTVSFGDDSEFISNVALAGGGAYVQVSTVSFGDNNRFINNPAVWSGGVFVHNSTVSFGGGSEFIDNSALWGGGGVYAQDSTLTFADCDFSGNSAESFGGCVAAQFSSINIGGSSKFTNNSAGYGGCVFAYTCELTLGGYQALTNNSADYGGALYLTVDSTIYLLPNTTVFFESNFARYRGGALFVEDNPFTYCMNIQTGGVLGASPCFIQIYVYEPGCIPVEKENRAEDLDQSIELRFQDNTAIEAGSVLYGGNLHSCGVCSSEITQYFTGEVAFNTWADVPSNLMSSDPYRVCICVENHPDCSQSNTPREIFPGVTFVIAVVAFGQYDGTVPAVIHAYTSEGIALDSLQSTQQSNNTCTNLPYTVKSTRDINVWREATLTLYADEPCSTNGLSLEVHVTFLPCPLGFSLSTGGSCECDQRLNEFEVHCDINDQSILRKDNVWIGFHEQSDNHSQGLILHPHCPFDYCKPESGSVNFTMNDTDLQCNYNRSGHLCGGCTHGYSLAVGSSRCLPCSNTFLTLLIVFVCAGLALVIFLFICKVTVAAGTISGLIFYANVVSVNQSIFHPSGETNILTVFIAWLNLDLGIETCFYDGMDEYSLMWLQFVFPIYIWLLVGLITILCNVSITAARVLGGTNPIAVLATLFFLSYTKLLRTIIATLSFTTLEYPDGETKVVWLYDGNIGYFDKNDGRHIALFLASLLVFLFLFLPYTIFLLFGQWILPRLDLNKLRWLSWANYVRIKSFLDAYHAPYKNRHRYWIGLLLVLRFIVFLISAIVDIESPQDPHVNLLVIIISTSILGLWAASGGVYKKWYLNVLETSFIFNLTVLSAATYQVKLAGANQAAVFYSSVSVAFSTFIGIITYHVFQRLRDSRAWRNLIRKRNERRRARDHGWEREDAAVDEEMEEMLPQAAPTVTYFEIPTDERREMRPITPPLSLPIACEPVDPSQGEDAAEDVEMEEMLPQAAPTVPPIHADKEVSPPAPPPPPVPTNFTDLREPLDLLTQ